MKATKFEFERRFWIICGIYALAFYLSRFDHTTCSLALRRLLAPSIQPNTHAAINFSRMVIACGALLVFIAAMLRTWATAYLRTVIVHDTNQHAEALVADGPFRYVRNPLYLASLIMAAGIGLLASRLGWLFLVGASWLFFYRLILREEEALRATQGASYRAYLHTVPRFLPSLQPCLSSGEQQPHWGQAFVGEAFGWLFGVAELCVAITLNATIAFVVFGAAFLTYHLVLLFMRKPAAPS